MLGAPYKTKSELKKKIGQPLRYIETSMFGPEFRETGTLTVVGPDPFRNRKWYAKVEVQDGIIKKVS